MERFSDRLRREIDEYAKHAAAENEHKLGAEPSVRAPKNLGPDVDIAAGQTCVSVCAPKKGPEPAVSGGAAIPADDTMAADHKSEPSVTVPKSPGPDANIAPEQTRVSEDRKASESVSASTPKETPAAMAAASGGAAIPTDETVPAGNRNVAVETPTAPKPGRLAALRGGALLPGESPDEFEQLRAAIFAAKKPAGVIEEIFAMEAAELTWEGFRDSQLSVVSFKTRAFDRIRDHYRCFDDEKVARRLWMHSPTAPKHVNDALSQRYGRSLSEVLAETRAENIEEFERMWRMRMSKLARRDASLREFDRHRLLVTTFSPQQETTESAGAKVLECQPPVEALAGDGAPALGEEIGSKTFIEEADRRARDDK